MKRLLLALLVVLGVATPAAAQVIGTQYISAASADCSTDGSCATFDAGSNPSIGFTISGTFSATLIFEATTDGVIWNSVQAVNTATGANGTAGSAASFAVQNSGFLKIRVRASAYVSGSAKVVATRGWASARLLTPTFVTVTATTFLGGDGTCAAPSYTFTSDTTQGLAKGCLVLGQGTLTAAAAALSTTATWNNAAITFDHLKAVITDTASAAGSLVINIKGGASGTSNLFSVDKNGSGAFLSNTVVAATSCWGWSGRGYMCGGSADGIVGLFNSGLTDFTRLNFGGATVSFPALKRNAAGIDVRLADDSDYATLTANIVNSIGSFKLNGKNTILATAPTISSGFGTTPSIAANNGTAAFTVNVGGGGAATSGVIGMPAATTGWICSVNNLTAAAAHVAYNTRQTASTTTSVTVENQTTSTGAAVAWAANNILNLSCIGY